MSQTVHAWPRGWGLTLACSGLLAALAVAIHAGYDDPTEGIRRVIRVTAHTSLAFFLLAFTASTWVKLWPGPLSFWLRRNRRQFGVTFAVSHIIHAIAIIALARRDPAMFWQLSSVGNIVAGGSAYVLILAMLATSFDAPARMIGTRAWTLLHVVGGWYLWGSFVFTNAKRIPTSEGFLIPVALLAVAAGLKLAVRWAKQRREPVLADGSPH